MPEKVTLGLIQSSDKGSHDQNVKSTFSLIRKAAERGAQIICTQELYTSDYFCRNHDESHFDKAVSIPGDLTDSTAGLAKELDVVIISSIFEKRDAGLYHNSATVHDADGLLLGIYRKMHIPEDPGFHEKYYFTPGDTGFKAFDTKFGRIGVLICWDQWFPEAARLTALEGAQVLFYPTAIGMLSDEGDDLKRQFMDAWEIMHRSHAVANGCYVAAINRTGTEAETRFWGDSFVSGPFGQIIAQAGEDEEILISEIDFASIEKNRRTWPFLRDRRIDAYAGLSKRFGK